MITRNQQKILETALSQVGYVEGKYNSNKYGAFYDCNRQPWCMYFVQWVFQQSGWKLSCFTGSCGEFLRYYKKRGPKQVSQKPKIGDIVIYGFGHTGIVLCVWPNGSICTIEGNTSPDASGNQANGGGVYVRNRIPKSSDWFVTPNIG